MNTTTWLYHDRWGAAHEFLRMAVGRRSSFCGRARILGLYVAPPRTRRCRRCVASRRHRAHAAPYVTVQLPPFAEVS